MRVVIALLGLVTACWSSTAAPGGAEPDPTTHSMRGSQHQTTQTQTQTAPPPAPCVFDAAAKQACDARGPRFSYGPRPFIYCSGVAPQPGTFEREHEAARTSPCACNDDDAIAQQREMCSQVPSAAPRP